MASSAHLLIFRCACSHVRGLWRAIFPIKRMACSNREACWGPCI